MAWVRFVAEGFDKGSYGYLTVVTPNMTDEEWKKSEVCFSEKRTESYIPDGPQTIRYDKHGCWWRNHLADNYKKKNFDFELARRTTEVYSKRYENAYNAALAAEQELKSLTPVLETTAVFEKNTLLTVTVKKDVHGNIIETPTFETSIMTDEERIGFEERERIFKEEERKREEELEKKRQAAEEQKRKEEEAKKQEEAEKNARYSKLTRNVLLVIAAVVIIFVAKSCIF